MTAVTDPFYAHPFLSGCLNSPGVKTHGRLLPQTASITQTPKYTHNPNLVSATPNSQVEKAKDQNQCQILQPPARKSEQSCNQPFGLHRAALAPPPSITPTCPCTK